MNSGKTYAIIGTRQTRRYFKAFHMNLDLLIGRIRKCLNVGEGKDVISGYWAQVIMELRRSKSDPSLSVSFAQVIQEGRASGWKAVTITLPE